MSMGEFLGIQPSELKSPFELRKQSSCSMQLTNKTDQFIAFKVKTTNPKKYSVRPNAGIVLPNSVCNVTVTMQAQKEAPPDMQCRDKFLVQSVIAPNGATNKDVTAEMFNREDGKVVDEFRLRVALIPANPPSPVPEGDEEGTSSAEDEIRKSSLHEVARSLKKSLGNSPSSEEFRRIKGNINSMREHAELLSSVGDDISEYKDEIRNSPSNLLINQPNPNETLMPVRGIDELPKPPVANRPPEKRQRVPSAYNRFLKDEIQRIKAGNPDISHRAALGAALQKIGLTSLTFTSDSCLINP